MILVDTSGLIAAFDRAERLHGRAVAALAAAAPPSLLSPFVLAEVDYLISQRYGQALEPSVLDQVASRVYRLESFSGEDIGAARDVIAAFPDLDVGLADASI